MVCAAVVYVALSCYGIETGGQDALVRRIGVAATLSADLVWVIGAPLALGWLCATVSSSRRLLRRRVVRSATSIALLATAVFVPLSYPPTSSHKEAAVAEALAALLYNQPVDTPDERGTLSETEPLTQKLGQIYFINEVGVPDALFLGAGLKPLPKDRRLDIDGGDALVRFAFSEVVEGGRRTWFMRFSYVFGSEGGIGYQIRIYRSPWVRRTAFVFEWIA